MGEFNSAWRSVEIEFAEVELLGPSSILDAAQTMLEAGQRGISTLIRMQRSRTAADSALVQEQISELDSALDALIARSREHLAARPRG